MTVHDMEDPVGESKGAPKPVNEAPAWMALGTAARASKEEAAEKVVVHAEEPALHACGVRTQ